MKTIKKSLLERSPLHYDLMSLNILYADLSSVGFSPVISRNDFVLRSRKLFHHHDVTPINYALDMEVNFFNERFFPSLKMMANHIVFKNSIREIIKNYFYGRLDIDTTSINDYYFLCDSIYQIFHNNDFIVIPLSEKYSA